MNILVLNYEYPPIGGGGGSVCKDICELLAEKGHKISVVTMRYKELPFYERVNGVDIYRVNCWRKAQSVCHPWEQLTYIFSACKFLKKHLKTYSYELCHVHFIIPTGVIGLWLKKKFKLKYIITAHGSDVPGHNDKRFKLLYKLLMGPWKKIVSQSEITVALSQHLERLLYKDYSSGHYMIIPNGIREEYYENMQPKKPYLLYMGRLQESKGVQYILEALKNMESIHLKVAGDGPYMDKLKILSQELHLTNRVEFLGWVENHSLRQRKLLGEASIYISASEFENCPITLLEARVSGAKLVLSDIESHREYGGENAFYFTGNKIGDIQKAIELAISTNYIPEKDFPYTWDKCIEKYENIYRKICKI